MPPFQAQNPAAIRAALAEAELTALARAGDPRAFGELVRRHGTTVRSLLRRMGADASTADDFAQDAFLVAFERIGELRSGGSFAAWVKKIAARLYLKRRRRGLDLALPVDETADPLEEAGGGLSAGMRLDLDQALKALSPAERLCVSLCCGAGFSHAEAAEALKTPLGTVKSHVNRGLARLRRRLEPDDGVPGS